MKNSSSIVQTQLAVGGHQLALALTGVRRVDLLDPSPLEHGPEPVAQPVASSFISGPLKIGPPDAAVVQLVLENIVDDVFYDRGLHAALNGEQHTRVYRLGYAAKGHHFVEESIA